MTKKQYNRNALTALNKILKCLNENLPILNKAAADFEERKAFDREQKQKEYIAAIYGDGDGHIGEQAWQRPGERMHTLSLSERQFSNGKTHMTEKEYLAFVDKLNGFDDNDDETPREVADSQARFTDVYGTTTLQAKAK